MGLERLSAESLGMPKYTEPIADYQMLANDLVVRAYYKGAMPVV